MPTKSFPSKTISEISKTKYFYLRAGADHKFIPVWVVVVDGRVLVARGTTGRKAGIARSSPMATAR